MDKFDLNSFDTVSACNAGAEIELKDPWTGASTGAFITIMGEDSEVFKNAFYKIRNRRNMEKAQAERQRQAAPILTAEQEEEDNIELLAACTKGWRGIARDGVEIPFSQEAAAQFYRQFPKFKQQANAAIGALENFIKAS